MPDFGRCSVDGAGKEEILSMSVSDEAKQDIKYARTVRPRWWALVAVGVLSFPVFWLFDHFGTLNTSLPTLDALVALSFVIFVKRRAYRQLWFWITMTAFTAFHAITILMIPWTSGWIPALVAGGFVSIDICAMLWILAAVESQSNQHTSR
ncbi:hypothetical protein [Sphingomonas sp.]|uniref:hypothetical protein n=1 Tax=Sphingomonas sp. TaxID=28214 RepID=UPI0038AC799A